MGSQGRILTLVGADGAGKSTLANRLCAALGDRGRYIYMGSNPASFTHALPTTRVWNWIKGASGRTVHHSGPPDPGASPRPSDAVIRARAHVKSLAVLGVRVSEDIYRMGVAAILARRGYVVVMDRHPYPDYYSRRVRETEGWLRWGDRLHGWLLEHVYARPRNLVLLDAPATVLHARKPEGSLAAVDARRHEYLEMIETLPASSVIVIDATRSAEAVLDELLRIVKDESTARKR